jgi:predicted DsbA family dithiol-disulfide isomerase
MNRERTSQELDQILTKEFLIEEHINKEKTLTQIALEVCCDLSTIRSRLTKFGLSAVDHYSKKIESMCYDCHGKI